MIPSQTSQIYEICEVLSIRKSLVNNLFQFELEYL